MFVLVQAGTRVCAGAGGVRGGRGVWVCGVWVQGAGDEGMSALVGAWGCGVVGLWARTLGSEGVSALVQVRSPSGPY